MTLIPGVRCRRRPRRSPMARAIAQSRQFRYNLKRTHCIWFIVRRRRVNRTLAMANCATARIRAYDDAAQETIRIPWRDHPPHLSRRRPLRHAGGATGARRDAGVRRGRCRRSSARAPRASPRRGAGRRKVALRSCSRPRTGSAGRCITDTQTFGVPFDLGAHWIYTPDTNPLVKLGGRGRADIYPRAARAERAHRPRAMRAMASWRIIPRRAGARATRHRAMPRARKADVAGRAAAAEGSRRLAAGASNSCSGR